MKRHGRIARGSGVALFTAFATCTATAMIALQLFLFFNLQLFIALGLSSPSLSALSAHFAYAGGEEVPFPGHVSPDQEQNKYPNSQHSILPNANPWKESGREVVMPLKDILGTWEIQDNNIRSQFSFTESNSFSDKNKFAEGMAEKTLEIIQIDPVSKQTIAKGLGSANLASKRPNTVTAIMRRVAINNSNNGSTKNNSAGSTTGSSANNDSGNNLNNIPETFGLALGAYKSEVPTCEGCPSFVAVITLSSGPNFENPRYYIASKIGIWPISSGFKTSQSYSQTQQQAQHEDDGDASNRGQHAFNQAEFTAVTDFSHFSEQFVKVGLEKK